MKNQIAVLTLGLAMLAASPAHAASITLNGSTTILPQYAVGTFTANATTENISFGTNNGPGVFDALQLRELSGPPVPEPGSLLLLGSGMLGFVRVLRRKAVTKINN